MIEGFEKHTVLDGREQELVEEVEALISDYGNDKPISSKSIERTFDIAGSKIRLIVQRLRRLKRPIGSNQGGYFWAETPEQLDSTIKHMEQRRDSIMITLKYMRRVRFSNKNQVQIFKRREE